MPDPPRPNAISRIPAGTWQTCSQRSQSFSSDLKPKFLNRVGNIESIHDWNDFSVGHLWLYNLHYFDDLNAQDSASRTSLHKEPINRWIAENPAPKGVGWEPYPCSLRIVNWIKWSLSGNELLPEWSKSLAMQAGWLARNLEWHLLGNHLFANAKALVFAGLFSHAQKINSPYSRFGLGELHGKNVNANIKSMGGISIGYWDPAKVNPGNPASYGKIDSTAFIFEIGILGNFVNHKTDFQQESSNYVTLSYLYVGFPVTRWWRTSLGVLPFSTI